MNRYPKSVASWLQEQRVSSRLHVAPVALENCRYWAMHDGRLAHRTGRFFSVIGIEAISNQPHLSGLQQPIIDQPEIGILGFVVRSSADGHEWLLQAKGEPGNMHGVQVGPTVQATLSNYMCVHGGKPTPLIECFVGQSSGGASILLDVEQSEQGSRFFGKYNRNCVASVTDDYPVPDSPLLNWFPASAVREALAVDYAVNTDARSVLFCSDWQLLTDGARLPFSRWELQGGFGEALHGSLASRSERHTLAEIESLLACARKSTELTVAVRPLSELKGWKFSDEGLFSDKKQQEFSLRAYAVQAPEREVRAWDQPLIVGHEVVNITQVCTRIAGTLHFLLRASPEIGFREAVQYAPSFIGDSQHLAIDWVSDAIADPRAVTHASVMQSDEGGRFMNSVARYSIVEIPEAWAEQESEAGVWMTLSQLHVLASRRGMLTNEARSVLSILLCWA